MMQHWYVRVAIAVVLGFATPFIRLLIPGDRGADSVGEALAYGPVVAVLLVVLIEVRHRTASGARQAGRRLRERTKG